MPRITRTLTGAALSLICLVGASSTAHAVTVFFDDFDHGQGATTNYTGLANWNVTAGSIDAYSNGGFSLPCPTLGCLDMDGSTSSAGTIETNTALNLGAGNHLLTLNVSGNRRVNTPDSMDVSVAGMLLGTITLDALDVFSVVTLPFSLAAATTGTIELSHAGGDNWGILLDWVRLESSDSQRRNPVSEAGSLTLLAIGLLAVAGVRRRRV